MVLAKDINRFRELKLRLLNGTHSFCCGFAALSGFRLVKDAMQDETFTKFITALMLEEIVPVVATETISTEEATVFAREVMDRFRNPYIDHQWEHIAVQYTSKMAMRNVPLIQAKYQQQEVSDTAMSLGFAAYLHFMKPQSAEGGKNFSNQEGMVLNDDKMHIVFAHWNKGLSEEESIVQILADQTIWGTDLSRFTAFVSAVTGHYFQLATQQPLALVKTADGEKSVA